MVFSAQRRFCRHLKINQLAQGTAECRIDYTVSLASPTNDSQRLCGECPVASYVGSILPPRLWGEESGSMIMVHAFGHPFWAG
jgi:hypothetical protein